GLVSSIGRALGGLLADVVKSKEQPA
uniref:Caerin-2.2 n=2 Tax=Ranoidea TaxID=2777416 RepID=CR22_RANCA|nr:RecName: Full=Caerin-2.2; Contains: RecName: Full=Caerin-2.2.1 [Ranoidea gilleni]P62571.1 RecName: Full=Caerin-2.2; Contains: RecName: Full=Caerin-2.2.1 [Ranoidea caerulea]